MEVTVAELPIGELVAGDRLHLHVDGEKIVAAVGTIGGAAFEEELGVEAFTHEAAVEIGEDHEDGVDLIGRYKPPQLIKIQQALVFAHLSASILPPSSPRCFARRATSSSGACATSRCRL